MAVVDSHSQARHDVHEDRGLAQMEHSQRGTSRGGDAESGRQGSGGGSAQIGSEGFCARREVLMTSDKLLDRVLCGLPSMHTLLGIAPVSRRWRLAARRVERVHGILDCSPYPLMTDAELLFLVRRFRRVVRSLVLRGYDLA